MSTKNKKNIIDSYDKYAEKWASRKKSQGKTQSEGANPIHKYLEKPAMYSVLPNISGKQLLCIGCGSGEECDYLSSLGAKVTGIDISERLVELAKEAYPKMDFYTMDMEKLEFHDNKFDYIYSSYTIHYVKNWLPALREAFRVLKPGGTYQFSTHHPIKWSGRTIRDVEKKTFLLGYTMYTNNTDFEVFGDYLNTREMHDTWFGDFDVTYYHKPLSEILREIKESGFSIDNFIEPKATEQAKVEYPQFYEVHTKIPHCMIFVLKKI